MVGSAAGEMLLPLLIGSLFESPSYGPQSFTAVIAAVGALGALVFAALLAVARVHK